VLLLLVLIACMCSLYLVFSVLPVCPMYLSGKSRHSIWYIPLLLYLSVCVFVCRMFWMVFCVRNAVDAKIQYILRQYSTAQQA
jgi:NhaP-type Na+/H+ or K+/H+ antiporter